LESVSAAAALVSASVSASVWVSASA
jgi:hypothetical protein